METKVKKIIEENPVALATVNSDGSPNVIGTAFVKVLEDKVVITDNFMASTKENVLRDDRVCLAVWDKDWEGYKLVGRGEYFTNGKWVDIIKEMKENEKLPAKGALVISPEKITKLG